VRHAFFEIHDFGLRGSRKCGYSQGAKLDVFGRPFGPYPSPSPPPGKWEMTIFFFRFFSNIAVSFFEFYINLKKIPFSKKGF